MTKTVYADQWYIQTTTCCCSATKNKKVTNNKCSPSKLEHYLCKVCESVCVWYGQVDIYDQDIPALKHVQLAYAGKWARVPYNWGKWTILKIQHWVAFLCTHTHTHTHTHTTWMSRVEGDKLVVAIIRSNNVIITTKAALDNGHARATIIYSTWAYSGGKLLRLQVDFRRHQPQIHTHTHIWTALLLCSFACYI